MALETSHGKYPPFPDDVVTAPLVSLSLAKLEDNQTTESLAFFEAAKNLGFFYLDLRESVAGRHLISLSEQLNSVQEEFFSLSCDEKEKYSRERLDKFFGYRFGDLAEKDKNGHPTRNETYNMRKDDFLGNVEPLPCPDLILQNWSLLQDFVRSCRGIIELMISHLERQLQLPTGTIADLHRRHERSGDHVRFNRKPIVPYSEAEARQGEHTDFGTLTILFNWLGGLQIRLPGTSDWVYVKPIPGCAIINLGDSLVKFTAGLLRSNIHRVLPPPGPQYPFSRHSLVYFSRPEDSVVLKRISGGLIDRQPVIDQEGPEMTSEDWILRRSVGDLKGIYTHKGGVELRMPVSVGYR